MEPDERILSIDSQDQAETLRAVLHSLKTEPLNLQQFADLIEVNE